MPYPAGAVLLAALLAVSCSTSVAAAPTTAAPTTAAPTTVPTPTAAPAPTTYINAKYGYSVALPEPYRRSDRLSLDGLSGRPSASDVFTARTPPDEIASETNSQTASPSWNYVAVVSVYGVVGAETPRSFYTAHEGAVGESFSDTTIQGREAVKITNGTNPPLEVIVKDGSRMFRISFKIYPFFDVPAGASREKLVSIVESFRFTTPLGSRVGACTSAAATTREVIDHYLTLSTSHDAPAVNDCFAASWRDRYVNWDDSAAIYASSGPAKVTEIHLTDTVNGCDRYGITVTFPSGATGFFAAVGPDHGMARIFETGTAMLAPPYATTRCE